MAEIISQQEGVRRRSTEGMQCRPGYSPTETQKAYNLIMEVDGGRAGSKLNTVEQLKEHYNEVFIPIHSHPDNDAVDDQNKDNITDVEAVDWLELLISCHHMYGYRLDGTPLGINFIPMDYYI